jgi:hypothetical protein
VSQYFSARHSMPQILSRFYNPSSIAAWPARFEWHSHCEPSGGARLLELHQGQVAINIKVTLTQVVRARSTRPSSSQTSEVDPCPSNSDF